jgi:hypothetical protein
MPDKKTLQRARRDKREGKAPTTQAPPPAKGAAAEKTRKSAARDYARGHGAPARRAATPKRARASAQALKRTWTRRYSVCAWNPAPMRGTLAALPVPCYMGPGR